MPAAGPGRCSGCSFIVEIGRIAQDVIKGVVGVKISQGGIVHVDSAAPGRLSGIFVSQQARLLVYINGGDGGGTAFGRPSRPINLFRFRYPKCGKRLADQPRLPIKRHLFLLEKHPGVVGP